MRALMSASPISRMSLASIRMPPFLSRHELRLHADLCRGESHCFTSNLRSHALELEHHSTWLDHRHPSFRRSLSLAHAGLGGLLGDRLVGGDSYPDLAATLDVARESHTRRLDLPVRHPARLHRLQTVVTKRHFVATSGEAFRSALETLPELYALGTKHFRISLDASRVSLAAAIFDDLALEDPDLHTDGAEGGFRGRSRVIDVRTQSVKRHASLVIALDARDFSAAQPASALDL